MVTTCEAKQLENRSAYKETVSLSRAKEFCNEDGASQNPNAGVCYRRKQIKIASVGMIAVL